MLSYYAPLLAYLFSFPLMLVCLFRLEPGILYFITLVPFIAVMRKMLLFPGGNNIPDFLLVSLFLGWIFSAIRADRKAVAWSPFNSIVILVVIGSAFNLLWSYNSNTFLPGVGIEILKSWKNYMILPMLYFIAYYNLDSEKTLKLMLICICLSLLGMTFNFQSTFKWLKTFHYDHSIRISGPFTFLGPNEMGIFFAMSVFMLLGVSYFIDNRYFKYFVRFVCLVSLYPLIYSYSRSAYACALVGIVVISILKDRRFFIVFSFLLVFYPFILPNSVVERIQMTFIDKNIATEEVLESSAIEVGDVTVNTVNRKRLWEKATVYFEDQPLFGIGFRAFLEREGKITHSLFYKILAEQGMVGLLVFLIFCLGALQQSYKLYRYSPSRLSQGIGLGVFTSSIIYLAGSIGGDISEYYNLMCIYWIFLGIVARYNIEYVKNSTESFHVYQQPALAKDK